MTEVSPAFFFAWRKTDNKIPPFTEFREKSMKILNPGAE
jgi:hypothetical protein